MDFKQILLNEGLKDWKIELTQDRCGLCMHGHNIILMPVKYKDCMALFLHELAHATTERKHDGVFADEYTRLVRKYMTPAPVANQLSN